eukprot:TRINITY_DN18887_c0_g1_i1.p1 TRINITY_DN18887_c0_g1~~TRINITY_DN18887_c0_g1_i1.p1  ORF type:complete len:120 (+),score=19.56 TRINITY_DN18887_c0_g1_i1:2-361(+)
MKTIHECDKEYNREIRKLKLEMSDELEVILREYNKAVKAVEGTEEEFVAKAKDEIESLMKQYDDISQNQELIAQEQEKNNEEEIKELEYYCCLTIVAIAIRICRKEKTKCYHLQKSACA